MEGFGVIDKSWIDLPKEDDRFIHGVNQFVQFARDNCHHKDVIPCPCDNCRNRGRALTHEVVTLHCYQKGFYKQYTFWRMHGETSQPPSVAFERGGRSNSTNFEVGGDFPFFEENVAFSTVVEELDGDNLDADNLGMQIRMLLVVGKDSRGRCRAMGPGVNKIAMKRMEPVLDQNYHLAKENSKLWKETQTNQMNFAMQLEEIRSTMLRQQEPSTTNSFGTSNSIPRSSNATSPETSKIGKEVNLLGGWLLDIVATGCVKEVDPTYKFHERCLGERSYLVYVDEVHAQDDALPFPHDAWCKNLGEICPGNVIWPKSCVEFLSSTSQS
ncbi:hypothetical protein IFM89_025426 [Coptis chinensis]|uniref:Transposase-associated domain-containing protein n=1 Tax=Coptis chinensis TaxID=261450 RepID=A0A835I696_9MAGN|nr:hypothetical protein IFM89_025426 [Coptis chinensis]